ncbi:unnamed protein product [Paramecium pentaurelia]|uniref:Arginyl-tRNA--protein transferase 1 n=1 Tax=Paramecium pentaurelia TaxID=43138 RepID=A0A8S1UKH6_9CILI|nr:unnamed protein product [Paramecium pentaurelia]
MSSVIQLNSISIKNETNCGYCNGGKSNKLWVTSGFYCYKMKVDEYQQLMDRGWRRCGVYYYRPALAQSCCQAYALRVVASKFQLRLTHEKVLKRIMRIKPVVLDNNNVPLQQEQKDQIQNNAITDLIKQQIQTDLDLSDLIILPKVGQQYTFKSIQYKEEDHIKYFKYIIINTLQKITKQQLNQTFAIEKEEHSNLLYQNFINSISELQIYEILLIKGYLNKVESDWVFGCNLIPYIYSKITTILKNLNLTFLKLEENNKYIELIQNQLLNLGFDFKISEQDHQLLIKTPQTLKEKILKSNVLYYLQKFDFQSNHPQETQTKKHHQIQIKWVKAQFQDDSFEVYKKYQKSVHDKERVSKMSYINFVCVDALDSQELGCWHMKYYLENQLIAVGVVDLLPQSVSSVYFFYDPDYKKYSLGVYGVLSEIEYIQKKQISSPQLQYYYMGFYIMDSKKMAYKAEYTPCELLCPRTYRWVSLTKQIKEKIEKITVYVQDVGLVDQREQENGQNMNIDRCTIDDMSFLDVDIENFIQQNVKISQAGKQFTISQLKKNYQQYFMNLFKDFLKKIGQELMKEFLFAIN